MALPRRVLQKVGVAKLDGFRSLASAMESADIQSPNSDRVSDPEQASSSWHAMPAVKLCSIEDSWFSSHLTLCTADIVYVVSSLVEQCT